MHSLGYCCINETLREKGIYSGRSLIRRTFNKKSAADLGLKNCKDLLTILEWNVANGIRVFRIGSEILPRQNDPIVGYKIADLYNSADILNALRDVGKYAYENSLLLSFHPGAYVCLGSPDISVQNVSINTIECENEIADALCQAAPLDIPINFHVGGSYGREWIETSKRFIASYNRLSASAKLRVVIENDDKAACWSVRRIYDFIYASTGLPITWDIHHSSFTREPEISLEEEFTIAKSTWNGRNMQIHYSQSADPIKNIPAHSDYYNKPLPAFLKDAINVHIHLECKKKELALQKYLLDFPQIYG